MKVLVSRLGIKLKRKKKGKDYRLLLLSLPFVLFIIIFSYIPLAGWSIAFFKYQPGLNLLEIPFVGLKNFKLIIDDSWYLADILVNTICMSLLRLMISPVAITLAILINEVRSTKLRRIVQTTTTLPHFVSMVIVYSLFFSMFSSAGVVNEVLMDIGIIEKPLNVLGNARIAWFFQMFVGLWKGCGWSAIIYLAAIAGIDQQLYDAIEIDGGGRFRKIYHITLPGVMPTFLVLLLLNFSHILHNGGLWEQVFVFMNPMVQDKLEILQYYIYRMGIVNGDYSFATAMGIANSSISLILLFTVNAISKRIRGESII
jgi:putative aldouronate transport system permease protein